MNLIIGIAGGSGSGKTTFANKLQAYFGPLSSILYQDNYYLDQSHKFDHDGGSVNFDHPNSIDFELFTKHVNRLKCDQNIELPHYDFATHKRLDKTTHFEAKRIIFLDGILLFSQDKLVESMDYKLFTDCPEDIRYKRRLKRDIEERGRTEEGVKTQFSKQVKPMHDQFVEPSKAVACDIINLHNFDDKLNEWINKINNFIK